MMCDLLLWINHCTVFGSTSACGTLGRLVDAIVCIYKSEGVDNVHKWVDDFVFWRFPMFLSNSGPWTYSYSESLVFEIVERLGWPWSKTKHFPFSFTFVYIGFPWNIPRRTVEITASKCAKFLAKLARWAPGSAVSRKDCENLIGSLNHCCLVVPNGRSRLPSLYQLSSSFSLARPNQFSRHRVTAAVLEDIEWWRDRLSQP